MFCFLFGFFGVFFVVCVVFLVREIFLCLVIYYSSQVGDMVEDRFRRIYVLGLFNFWYVDLGMVLQLFIWDLFFIGLQVFSKQGFNLGQIVQIFGERVDMRKGRYCFRSIWVFLYRLGQSCFGFFFQVWGRGELLQLCLGVLVQVEGLYFIAYSVQSLFWYSQEFFVLSVIMYLQFLIQLLIGFIIWFVLGGQFILFFQLFCEGIVDLKVRKWRLRRVGMVQVVLVGLVFFLEFGGCFLFYLSLVIRVVLGILNVDGEVFMLFFLVRNFVLVFLVVIGQKSEQRFFCRVYRYKGFGKQVIVEGLGFFVQGRFIFGVIYTQEFIYYY